MTHGAFQSEQGGGLNAGHRQGVSSKGRCPEWCDSSRSIYSSNPCVRAEKAAWGWVTASVARCCTQDIHSFTFDSTCAVTYSREPMAAPRYGLPSGVIFTPMPVKMETAAA